ncbi:MAG TPA: cytidylate kinase-like family protein [Candidatus Dormibacteraeota bacterium]|nr:cytidylate kinase-like family protein [Candidatus Dormibacteraeota bacterium]
MGTVTIAATYGAGGSVVAPAVAERLGLPFIERAIPVAVAERIHEPLEEALADDEAVHTSAVGRALDSVLSTSGLFVGVPQSPEEMGVLPEIAQAEAVLRRVAGEGGAVILGRAGVFVLKGHSNVLHVRLDGDVEARRHAAMARLRLDYPTVKRIQLQTDRARKAYVGHFYPRAGAWEDPSHYHLVLDSTAISLDACTEIIVRAAADVFGKSAPSAGGS